VLQAPEPGIAQKQPESPVSAGAGDTWKHAPGRPFPWFMGKPLESRDLPSFRAVSRMRLGLPKTQTPCFQGEPGEQVIRGEITSETSETKGWDRTRRRSCVSLETRGKAGPVSIYLAEPRTSPKSRVFSQIHVFLGCPNGVFYLPRRFQVGTQVLSAYWAFLEPSFGPPS